MYRDFLSTPAIFKLLERVRLPSRNSLSAGICSRSCRTGAARLGSARRGAAPARSFSLSLLPSRPSGNKISRIPFTFQDSDCSRALWNGLPSLFFLSGTSADGKYRVSEFAGRCRSTVRPVRDAPPYGIEKGCRRFLARRTIASFYPGVGPFMSVVNARRVERAPLPSLLLIERKIRESRVERKRERERDPAGRSDLSPIITTRTVTFIISRSHFVERGLRSAQRVIRRIHRSYFYDDEIGAREMNLWHNKSARCASECARYRYPVAYRTYIRRKT